MASETELGSPPAPMATAQTMGENIFARLERLAEVSDEPGALTRLYLSPAHRKAAELVAGWMREAGMSAHVDAVGNVVGRYEAEGANAKVLLVGSHIDTVRNAGNFDGNLGVVGAIEVVARLHRERRRLPFAIEVIAFGDEEGVRFPTTLGGSRALAGLFDPTALDEYDSEGFSRREALVAFGCDPSAISAEARDPSRVLGYVELHIEQGPALESAGAAVAVVTAISGANRGEVIVIGESGHAGTVPMALRRDALLAAAEMIVAIERRARADTDLVATVGRLSIADSATNTVPGKVTFSLDVRSPNDAARAWVVGDIEDAVTQIARGRGVRAELQLGHEAHASVCDPQLVNALGASMTRLALPERRMSSGAGHDAMAFSGRIPFAMLFIRCRGGVSHSPREYASPEDIDIGARVLADFIDHFEAS